MLQPLSRARFADVKDAPRILQMCTESMRLNFRINTVNDVLYVIQNSVLCICQMDQRSKIVGFVSLKDYPLSPSIHPSGWEEVIWKRYKYENMNSRNSLFIHLMCWEIDYGRELVDRMLKSVFLHDNYLYYIAMIKHLKDYWDLVPGQPGAEASFKRVQAAEKGRRFDMPQLCVTERKDISPRLKIRKAVEEDNDDIIPILERHSKKLREMYGDFYIAELISQHPESDRVLLVCEYKEFAIGVMCLNTQINFEALEEAFELSPYAGLRHLTSVTMEDPEKDSVSKYRTLSVDDTTKSETDSRRPSKQITWKPEEPEIEETSSSESPTDMNIDPYLRFISMFDDNEEDDDADFDIVNIDQEILRIPRLMSYDIVPECTSDYFMRMLGISCQSPIDANLQENDSLKKKSITISANPDNRLMYKRYFGEPNAFVLELFAMHPDHDERMGFDMLQVAFELFPDREYCILCLPSSHIAFPLMKHFTLVTPIHNKMRFIFDSLHVAHVNSVRGQIRVRPGELFDIPRVSEILENAARKSNTMDLFEKGINSNSLFSFVVLTEKQPVGVVIVGPLDEEGKTVRTLFALDPEPLRADTDGAILAGVMIPSLCPHARWVLRDILRQSKYTSLFWVSRLITKSDSAVGRNLMSFVSYMKPVRPRLNLNKKTPESIKEISAPYSLWHFDRVISSIPRTKVNNAIVVVGASKTGLSFLERLLMGPESSFMLFTNVTLISERGLTATAAECLMAADICVPKDGIYTDRHLKSIPFYYYIDIITAVMIKIDTKRKCVHLKNGSIKYYDTLVLTCGQQFQHPNYLINAIEVAHDVKAGKLCERILMDDVSYRPESVEQPLSLPENVMLINSIQDANTNLRKLLRMISERSKHEDLSNISNENRVIVYGNCIEAYCCLAALLELGLSSDMLVFVEPPLEGMRVNCFNNEVVDIRIQKSIELLGITVHRNSQLTGWRLSQDRVESIRFISRLHVFKLKAFALFYYGPKAMDINAFKAINESGLVYDGGVVIGPDFETNHPNIFAAGTCTKYSRALYADKYLHSYYCSEDVGETLAKLFLKRLNPYLLSSPDEFLGTHDGCVPRYTSSMVNFIGSSLNISKQSWQTLAYPSSDSQRGLKHPRRWNPTYKFYAPLVQWATLPGPYYYMRLRKPGADIPMEVFMALPNQGHTLLTDKEGNYFKLQLNSLHCVESVTCLSKKPFQSEVLINLYAKHESFFDNLLTRYNNGLIDDLYEYFSQPWMLALFQDQFQDTLFDIEAHDTEEKVPESVRASISTVYESSCSETKCNDVECGQGSEELAKALEKWRNIKGDSITMNSLANYIRRYEIVNPQYAQPAYGFEEECPRCDT